MRRLLLRCYPARWRARYGEEFAAVLEERPLGPFDVADVLLGALDAHLHLRGLGAASQHGRGFAMSLRIGGFAAITGGALWTLTLIAAAILNRDGGSDVWTLFLVAGTLAILTALVGLSAFPARRYPALVWAACIVPAIGAVVAIVGLVAMPIVGDRPFIGDYSPWSVWMLGTIGLLIGSALFGIAIWLTSSFSRVGAALLCVGALTLIPAMGIAPMGLFPEALGPVIAFVMFVAFGSGWAWLGVSALRLDARGFRPRPGPALS